MDPNRFTLSFFSGEAKLTDLELRPEVLEEMLGLPPWLMAKSATVASVKASVYWTRIKSQPIVITIEGMKVELHATDKPNFVSNSDLISEAGPATSGKDGKAKAEKYGFTDGVIDGMTININFVALKIVGPDWQLDLHVIDVKLYSTSNTWEYSKDLDVTRHKDKNAPNGGSITLFKRLSVSQVIAKITAKTNRLPKAALREPMRFELVKPRLKIYRTYATEVY